MLQLQLSDQESITFWSTEIHPSRKGELQDIIFLNAINYKPTVCQLLQPVQNTLVTVDKSNVNSKCPAL